MNSRSGNLSSLVAAARAGIPEQERDSMAISALRQEGLEAFLATGFDLNRREEWKYSDLKLFSDGRFAPINDREISPGSIDLQAAQGARLVFINGIFSALHSRLDGLADGVTIKPLAGVDCPALGELARCEESPFTALNTAFWNDGLLLELAEGVALEDPVHLHFVTNDDAAGKLVASRNLIKAGKGSRATVIEHYMGNSGSEYLQAPVTEIFCGEDSRVTHLKIIDESVTALHLGSTHVKQDQGSRFTSREFAMSGTLVRRELHLDLAGTGAGCDLTALSMAGKNEQRDMRTRVEHLVSGCETHELYKGLYDGHSRGVFDGKILVARDAQQTNAHQTNRNLLLSDDAVSYSIPRLEIYADDVKCSHGSTTGQLDDEQVFFLRSRGFDASTARTMLANAFAREILDGVDDEDLRGELDSAITDRLARSVKGK